MLVRTFAETNQDFDKSNVSSDVSNKLGEKNASRKGYQYTIRKPQNGAARFITVIYPFEAVSTLDKLTMVLSLPIIPAKMQVHSIQTVLL